jgi:hypothetical protein
MSHKHRRFWALLHDAMRLMIRFVMRAQRPSKKIRFRAGKTMPWPAVLHDFDCFNSVNPQYEPMRRLVYALCACASHELHATQTMGGNLLLSPEEELHKDDNVLLISYSPEQQVFHFEHRTISKNDDSKDAGIAEAWPTLRLFVGYKFGIRLPLEQPEQEAMQTESQPV